MVQVKELTPELWPDLEALFGSNGACGGCWCMSWRIKKGEKWDAVKGEEAKRRLQEGVAGRSVHGAIAYLDDVPVGWVTFGPRKDFSRLDRAPSFVCDDAENVWSVPCFFIKSKSRGKGVGTALLDFALKVMKKKKVKMVEGYPSKPGKDGKYVAAFAWTGTQSMFAKAGFEVVGNQDGGKQRVRKIL